MDISINKQFKDLIKQKYRDFCISYQNTKKPTPEYLINWVAEVWWPDKISEKTIKNSFKWYFLGLVLFQTNAGLNLKLDGSEDFSFNWPKPQDMILIEDLPSLRKNNEINNINYNIINNDENEEEQEDILFDYNRYSIEILENK